MTAAGQVKSALIARLNAAGLAAEAAFSRERAAEPATAVLAVGVREMKLTRAGLVDYLGRRYDAVRGTEVEVYGRTMTLRLSLDAFAPRALGAAGCEEAADAAAEALLTAPVGGVAVEEIVWQETAWDKTYGLFRRAGTLVCHAVLTAEAADDETVLETFILRGVVSNERDDP